MSDKIEMIVQDCRDGNNGIVYEEGAIVLALRECVNGKAVRRNPDDVWESVFSQGTRLTIIVHGEEKP